MHKTIKKIFKYTSCVLLSLLVILITGICYLYFSADMRTPKHEPSIIMTKVSHADTTTMVPAEVLYNDMTATSCATAKADCGSCL